MIAIAGLFFILAMVFSGFKTFSPGEAEITTVLQTLASLAVLALLVERSVQVLRVVYLDDRIDAETARSLTISPTSINSDEDFVARTDDDQKLSRQQIEDEQERQTSIRTTLAALIMSLVLALVGIRLLATFVPAEGLRSCIVEGTANWEQYFQTLQEALTAFLATVPEAERAQFLATFNAVCSAEAWQRRFFAGADVVLTGALIAGGSNHP